jgi:hypothetical protein
MWTTGSRSATSRSSHGEISTSGQQTLRAYSGQRQTKASRARRIFAAWFVPPHLQWLRYTYGGTRRPINRGWVLRDVTCRTRWLRQIVRAVVQVAPSAAAVAIVLLEMGFGLVVLGGVACGLLLAVLYSLAYIDQSAEQRLVKHGYDPEQVKLTLHERYEREHADEIARYMQTYRKEAARTSQVL